MQYKQAKCQHCNGEHLTSDNRLCGACGGIGFLPVPVDPIDRLISDILAIEGFTPNQIGRFLTEGEKSK